MSVINTNIKSLISQNALGLNNRSLATAMEQLSSGKRINSAADDAAGLAISTRMTAQIQSLSQSVRNANDGISLAQTAEGALVEITNMVHRMRELAIQAANDTNSDDDRSYLDLEFQQLKAEINRIGGSTEWNGMRVLSGTAGDEGTFLFQVGSRKDQVISLAIPNMSTTPATGADPGGELQAIHNDDIATRTTANDTLAHLDTALDNISDARATMGAVINRLTYAGDNLNNVITNTSESRSRILDADYAKASSELARTQIIQQAATAVLAQANTSQQTVLKLLQG